MRLFRVYQDLLRRRPFLVQAVQTGTLMGTGDFMAQKFIEKKTFKQYNVPRTVQFASIGFCFAGPVLRIWYGFLNKHLGSGGQAAIKKVLIDQLILAPVFLGLLLTTVGLMNGNSINTIQDNLKAKYKDVLIANYYVWPWVQLVNFLWIPVNYQVLFVQLVAVFWNTYLSWKANQEPSVV